MQTLVDFTNCPPGYREYGGSDSKKSIEYSGEKYMLKFPETKDKKNPLQTSKVNNVISEYIGSHIIASLGLPVHETLLGTYEEELVVACKDFSNPGNQLQEFAWFMLSMYRKDEIGRMPAYDQIYDVMSTHPLLNQMSYQAIQRYWETFVADALIGNFDRHKGNWGYLVNEVSKTIQLAPIYDCGSCLYPGLSEEGMLHVLENPDEINMRIYEFPKAALLKDHDFRNEKKIKYHEMLLSDDPYCVRALLSIYPKINISKIYEIIDNTPVINETRKNFYKTMIKERYDKILKPAYKKHKQTTKLLHQQAFHNFNNEQVCLSIANNQIVAPKTLCALSQSPFRSVRIAVAQNLNTDLRTLNLLKNDPNAAGYVEIHPNFLNKSSSIPSPLRWL